MEVFPEELILDENPINGYGISLGNNIIVGVYTAISEELKQEGMVRDLIRQVQNLRKESGLKVEDRIEIGILGSKELNAADMALKFDQDAAKKAQSRQAEAEKALQTIGKKVQEIHKEREKI